MYMRLQEALRVPMVLLQRRTWDEPISSLCGQHICDSVTADNVYVDSLHMAAWVELHMYIYDWLCAQQVHGRTALGVRCDSVLQPWLWPSGLCTGGSASLAVCVRVVVETELYLGLGV